MPAQLNLLDFNNAVSPFDVRHYYIALPEYATA